MATNRNYAIGFGGYLDTTTLDKQIKEIENKKRNLKFTTDDKAVKDTTKSVKDLDGALKDQDKTMQGNLLTFQAANMILSKTIDVMSSMVEQVYELNGAVVEYKKVTDLSGEALDKYVDKLSKMGGQVARTGTEMVEAATEFKKNSFSDEDSASLALVATTYQNIADEAISAGDSASFLIAMMKAFNVEAENATSIIDAVNEASNAFAVSSSDISTALPKVSATLAQAGNTMSESIGLLVGATELMPGNASRVARGLRTITLGLQGMDDEGTKNFELVSKLQTEFDKLGISLAGADGQLRSSYDILYDLNGIWSTLDRNTQAYVAELIAGKNQIDVFNALMSNFNSTISANETAMNSAGSAARENAAYMEGLEAKVSALKQSFQELSTALIDDDVAGGILDFANVLLQLVNTDAGRLALIGVALTSVTIASKGLFDAIKVGLLGSLGALSPYLIGTLAVVTALVAFAPQIIDFFDGLIDPIGNTTKKLEKNNVEIEQTQKRLEELENTPWYDRTPEINKEIEELKKYNAELEKANEKLIQRRANAAYDEITKDRQTTRSSFDVYSGGNMVQQGLGSTQEVLSWIKNASGEVYNNLEEARQAGWEIAEGLAYGIESAEDYYKRIIIQQRQFNANIADGKILTAEENATYQENNRQLEMLVNNKELAVNATEELDDVYNKYAVSATKVLNKSNELVDGLREQTRTQEIVADGFRITQEAAEQLIATNPELAKSIGQVNDSFYMEKQSLYDLAQAGNTVAQQMVKDQIALTEKTIQETKKRIEALIIEKRAYLQTAMTDVGSGNLFYAGFKKEELANEKSLLASQIAELENIKSAISSFPKTNPLQPASGSKSEAKKDYKTAEELYQEHLDKLEDSLKKSLERQARYYQELADEQKRIQEQAQSEADAYVVYSNFVKESIDEKIAGYQAEITALEKANQERQEEIALQEKLNNLAKAKSTQVMVYKDGRFQYANDIDAVSSAQSDLSEYQRERELAEEKQYWQDKIDELEKYKDQWNNFTKDYENSANMQLLIQSNLFTNEDLIFANRIQSAQTFADKYSQAMQRVAEASRLMAEYQAKADGYSNAASNLGSSSTDWSQAWRDVDAAQKAGTISSAEANELKNYYHSEKTKEMAGTGATFNSSSGTWSTPKYANGTLSAKGGLSLVGDGGDGRNAELRVLNKGDGIIPADITRNLWALGSNPYAYMTNAYRAIAGKNSGGDMYSFAIDKLELPNAKDAPSIIEGLRNYAHQYSLQRT